MNGIERMIELTEKELAVVREMLSDCKKFGYEPMAAAYVERENELKDQLDGFKKLAAATH